MFESRQRHYFMFTTQNSASTVFKFTVQKLEIMGSYKKQVMALQDETLFQGCSKVRVCFLFWIPT